MKEHTYQMGWWQQLVHDAKEQDADRSHTGIVLAFLPLVW
jgi:hypothetical protein